ncbi:MAG: hypothetical protein RL318_829 [Fibrobacterota bacterium]|jgi:YD repeat-containing protein
MRFLPALCLLPTLVAALPRLLDNALRANPQIYAADTTRYTQTFHENPWMQGDFPTKGQYAVRSRDLMGRPLEVIANEASGGAAPALRYEVRHGWDGNMPSKWIRSNLSLKNSPSFEVARTYRGDSLVRMDSSWTSWDPASRVLVERSSQDTLCPFRDSTLLDEQLRPVQVKSCQEGTWIKVQENGTLVQEGYRSWGLVKLWYRAQEDGLPWKELDWDRDGDTAAWELRDSGQTQGNPNRPTSLSGCWRFPGPAWLDGFSNPVTERADYRWNSEGRLEGISYLVADTVQSTMEYAYDEKGRLIREITRKTGLDTVTWSYAQAIPQSISGRSGARLSLVQDRDGMRVVGGDVQESALLDAKGRLLWRQGKGNVLHLPRMDGVAILKIRLLSGEQAWRIAPNSLR